MKFDMSSVSRSQLGVLLALGAVTGMILVVVFVISPMKQNIFVLRKDLQAQQERSNKALSGVRSINSLESELKRLTDFIGAETNSYLLRPVLGSYPVTHDIYRLALATGFAIANVRETGREDTPFKIDTPAPQPRGRRSASADTKRGGNAERPSGFARYKVEITGEGSYAATFALIELLELENPYCGVVDLKIVGQQARPERHRVVIALEWPVEAPKRVAATRR